jgi:2,3-diketo-5-methylthio-1-phosphopentane phosphatase
VVINTENSVAIVASLSNPLRADNHGVVYWSYVIISPQYLNCLRLSASTRYQLHLDHIGQSDQHVATNIIIGHLWTTGFSTGDLKTPLFPDVVPTLEAWKAAGKTLAIFSSGSVQAQLQFFAYVQDGESTRNIKHLFSAHYDTVNAGPKLEKASYEKICRELNVDVSKVTFLTDNVKGTSYAAHSVLVLYMKHHRTPSRRIIAPQVGPSTPPQPSTSHHLILTLHPIHSHFPLGERECLAVSCPLKQSRPLPSPFSSARLPRSFTMLPKLYGDFNLADSTRLQRPTLQPRQMSTPSLSIARATHRCPLMQRPRTQSSRN